jgi:hypothetical protein
VRQTLAIGAAEPDSSGGISTRTHRRDRLALPPLLGGITLPLQLCAQADTPAHTTRGPRVVGGPLCGVCVRRCPTLPHPGGCSTIGAGGLSFRVRNGAGRFPSAMAAVTCVELCGRWCRVVTPVPAVLQELHSGCVVCVFVVSPRPISTGQLHTLRCFHFRPINPVV